MDESSAALVPTQSGGDTLPEGRIYHRMIRRLKSGEFRLYAKSKDTSTGKRRNLGTFPTLDEAKKHERQVHFFKRHSGAR